MYESYYGLKGKPFDIRPDPNFLYLSPKHEAALTYLEYGLMDNIGTVLLTGEVGTGKTTLLRYAVNHYCKQLLTAVIYNTNLTPDQLIEAILDAYGLDYIHGDKAKNLAKLNSFLQNQARKKRRVLLIIDEAQNLSFETLEEVRMLGNIQNDDIMLLQIMLVGQPELRFRLKRPEFLQFAQRISVNYHIPALDKAETMAYIAHRIQQAGGNPKLFTQKALEKIYEHTKGIPRNINVLCDYALVYGFGNELETVDVDIIEQVLREKNDVGLVFIEATVMNTAGATPDKTAHRGNGDNSNSRLDRIEGDLNRIDQSFRTEISNLRAQIDKIRQDVTNSLTKLYMFERKRNEELTRKYTDLKNKTGSEAN